MNKCFLLGLLIKIYILSFGIEYLPAQTFPADPSKMTVSVKQHSVGRGKVVSNLGFLARPPQFELDDYPALFKYNDDPQTFAKSTAQELILAGEGRNALFVGGKIGAHKVTCAEDWSDLSNFSGFEFFPTGEPWDSIWVVARDEVVDIPYWPNYKGISDQDFVCRFDDYHINAPDQTRPLGIEVIQTTHA